MIRRLSASILTVPASRVRGALSVAIACAAWTCGVAGVAGVAGAEPAPATSVAPASAPARAARGEYRRFTLAPTAPPSPVLKHRFDYEPYQRTAGNAAPLYLQAILLLPDEEEAFQTPVNELIDLAEAGDEAAFLAKARSFFETKHAFRETLSVATRRDHCDWDLAIREQGFATLLPHLNHARSIANYLRGRAEYEALSGRPDEAIRTLREGLVFGRDIGEGGLLINALVGIGISAAELNAVAKVASRPDSPNLYWALATLPRPMFDIRRAVEHEGIGMIYDVPGVRRFVEGETLAPDDWKKLFEDVIDLYTRHAGPSDRPSPAKRQLGTAGLMITSLPAAREYYASTRKLPPEAVEALDPYVVVGTYMLEPFIAMTQRSAALLALPYPQMAPALRDLRNEMQGLKADGSGTVPMMLLSILFPSYERAAESFVRLDRTVAAMTAVEAIRSYAAAHNGELPPTLDAIKDTPALDNPRSGKPFDYRVENGVATLSDPEPADWPLRYEVRIRR